VAGGDRQQQHLALPWCQALGKFCDWLTTH
jgi:hypothetical protein